MAHAHSNLPITDYGKPTYWDERYSATEGQTFDWHVPWDSLKQHLLPFLSTSTGFEILIPGCGTSSLGPNLYDSGYVNVTNIDSSSVVIQQMADRYADREEMEFTVMDTRNLEFLPDACFSLIIDKALTDSILTSPTNLPSLTASLLELCRVLKPNSTYLMISYAPPQMRLHYLQAKGLDWTVECRKVGKEPLPQGMEVPGSLGDYHYMYVCTKRGVGAAGLPQQMQQGPGN